MSGGLEQWKAPIWAHNLEIRELHSEIMSGLWMGGTHDRDVRHLARGDDVQDICPADYDAVVTMYADANPVGWGVDELRVSLYDSPNGLSEADAERVIEAARWAHARWRRGEKVLIRCQAGCNRSGLVTALVLMLNGWSASRAITRIRARRSRHALFNESFVHWLLRSSIGVDLDVSDDDEAAS